MREIDVLITGELVGQKVHFAIECKDYKRKVDSHHIDAFIGKLQDVGLATQTSIFVTTRGYTTQAVERAHEVGMKTLVLKHNEEINIKTEVLNALQSHVFIFCAITEIEVKTDEIFDMSSFEHFKFFDKKGTFVGLLPDFIWESWIRGTPSANLGKYSYRVNISDEICYLQDGKKNCINFIRVDYQVGALVFQFKGQAKRYHLYNAHEQKTELYKVKADFSTSKPTPFVFHDESTLLKFLNEQCAIAKIEFPRIKLPKIVMNQGLLWPIPIRVSEYFKTISPEDAAQEVQKLAEGPDNNFWEFDTIYNEIMKNIENFPNVRFTYHPL